MRPIFWLFFFFALYVWISITGNEEMVIERGKALYYIIVRWFDDAEVDFHWDEVPKAKTKERSRRWD